MSVYSRMTTSALTDKLFRWVVRDSNIERLKPVWPHFKSSEDIQQLRRGQPIRVKSCWNGIAAFNADLLLDGRPKPFTNSSAPSSVSWPLRFRRSGECLTSECLSINYDMHLLLANTRLPEIYINPTVQVGESFPPYMRFSWLIMITLQLTTSRPSSCTPDYCTGE